MKMCYRGVSYDYNPTQIQVDETTKAVKCRGVAYELDSVALNLKEKSEEVVVYRGAPLSNAKQSKFLGQVCQKNPIGLTVVRKQSRFLGQTCDTDTIALITA